MVYQWIKKLQLQLLPPTCLLCGAPGESERDLCGGCRADLPGNDPACRRCGMPLALGAEICGTCLQQPPPIERSFAPLLYQPPVDFLIKQLKFKGQLACARLLGEWLGAALERRGGPWPEAIIPVPLHASRLRERSFNQSLELARFVAGRLQVALDSATVRRIRHTVPQVELKAAERSGNVRGAFAVVRPIALRHVAILDDVVTTGSTVNEIARVLRAAGVEEIEVWACTRTVR